MKTTRRSSNIAKTAWVARSAKRTYKFYARNNTIYTRSVLTQGKRSFSLLASTTTSSSSSSSFSKAVPFIIGVSAGLALTTYSFHGKETNWDEIRKEIKALLNDPNYDDGSYGPVLIRLAWHAAGTYDKADGSGGSSGGTMRFAHEAGDGANAGLKVARDLLEPIKKKYPDISYGDLWTLAGSVAIEELGGPKIDWRPGRVDKDESHQPPHGRLPDASKDASHIRDIFYRMGFTDKEIVALAGAHALGRCHRDRSGYDGPWTSAPTVFTNEYFVLLLESKWTPKKWDGPLQYEDETKTLMMLPADLAFVQDPKFRPYVELYAKDEAAFFRDFAAAWKKLIENGVQFKTEEKKTESTSWWKKLFG